MRIPPFVALMLVLARAACGAEPGLPAYDHFFEHVRPLLAHKCTACHGVEKQEGGLRMDTSAIFAGGDSGPAIVPGKPEESLIVQAVRHTHEGLAMPPKEKLDGKQVATLVDWIRKGAVWVDPPVVLFEDEEAIVASAEPGTAAMRLTTADHHSGNAALSISGGTRKVSGWRYKIAEKPSPGEFRYLRFAWKTQGDGSASIEVAHDGTLPPSKAAGRYVVGRAPAEVAANPAEAGLPNPWSTLTIDLWKDLGGVTLSGLSLAAGGAAETLFDAIVLGPSLESLDAYKPGRGELAYRTTTVNRERHGDAWSDPQNPIAKLWGGKRLDLWSLRKPVRLAPPEVKQADWPKTAVDRFVLARLEQQGLAPSAEAQRMVLIRRASFDVTGLPPTPEEVQAFVNDPGADAYERLVERLLASPRYGEHWARRWLDVVRYADTNGFERDEYRPTAYRYRDYVVRSFNADKPYDQFVREQLAGDEMIAGKPLEGAAIEKMIATGFMRQGPYDTTSSIFEEDAKSRDQLMADLVNTTGSAFLGVTLACCRCHDHKYDPFSQADHFRLQAFFAAVKAHDPIIEPAPPEQAIAEAHHKGLRDKSRRRDELRAIGREKVLAERRASFPAEIQELLKLEPQKRDAAAQASLEPYLKKLEVTVQEARFALTGDIRQEHDQLVTDIDLYEKLKPDLRIALCVTDVGDSAPPTRILSLGDYQKPLDEVPAGFFSILDPNPADVGHPPSPGTTGRRTALAQWIVSPENPLTARVIVNRLWQQYFGRGIVATPNDFGFSGTRPTHPELLDYLATELVDRGWSLKSMHRLILLSATYRQASADDPARRAIDPDNVYFWRQTPRRLEAEALRDAMLAVSGRLLPLDGGPPRWPQLPEALLRGNPKFTESPIEGWSVVPEEQSYVRTVFTVQKRSLLQPLLESFDLPDPTVSCARRNITTVAPQALMLLNSPFAVAMAQGLAERATKEADNRPTKTVERTFWLTLGRGPDEEERELCLDLLVRHAANHAARLQASGSKQPGQIEHDARRAATTDLARALLNMSEFVYID